MSKTKVIVRKVASPYSERNGYAAEFLAKDGTRFFVAEQFGKELSEDEEQLARPLDIVHLVGFAFRYAKRNGYAMSKTIKDFGAVALEECRKYDAVRAELAKCRKARNELAQLVIDIALPKSARKLDADGRTDEEVKAAYANAVTTYDNRIKWATPKLDAFRKAATRMAAVLEMTEDERTVLKCNTTGRNVIK